MEATATLESNNRSSSHLGRRPHLPPRRCLARPVDPGVKRLWRDPLQEDANLSERDAVPVADPASAIARPYRSAARRLFLRPGAGKASYPLGRSVAGPGDTVGPSLTRAYPLRVGSSLSPKLATCPKTP